MNDEFTPGAGVRYYDALVAIRYAEEAGELIHNHIDIQKSEDGTRQEAAR